MLSDALNFMYILVVDVFLYDFQHGNDDRYPGGQAHTRLL